VKAFWLGKPGLSRVQRGFATSQRATDVSVLPTSARLLPPRPPRETRFQFGVEVLPRKNGGATSVLSAEVARQFGEVTPGQSPNRGDEGFEFNRL